MSSVSEDRETDRKFPNRYIRLPRPFLEIVVSKIEKTDRLHQSNMQNIYMLCVSYYTSDEEGQVKTMGDW